MNKRAIAVISTLLVLLLSTFIYVQLSKSESKCSDKDYETNNCTPAGKCHPNPSIDAVTDCDVKDYDRPLRTDV